MSKCDEVLQLNVSKGLNGDQADRCLERDSPLETALVQLSQFFRKS